MSLTPEALRAKMWSDEGVKETRRVVAVLTRCEEIEVVVEWLAEQYGDDPTFQIEDRGPYYRVDCDEGFEVTSTRSNRLSGTPTTCSTSSSACRRPSAAR